jgi:hypothetical protein
VTTEPITGRRDPHRRAITAINRLHQTRIVVLDAADARADRAAHQAVGRVGGQQRLQRASSAGWAATSKLSIPVENPGDEALTLSLRIHSDPDRSLSGKVAIAPHSAGDLAIWIAMHLRRGRWA